MIKNKTTLLSFGSCIKMWVFLVCLIFIGNQQIVAQASAEYQIKAVFLYNFTRFIDWPSTSFPTSGSPFIIGILGNDPFGEYLDETVKDETTGQHPIVIKRYKSLKEVENCQILFINAPDTNTIKMMLTEIKDKNILTVSDAANFAAWGGVIGFFLDNNRIRMEINVSAAKEASLSISSKLLGVAKIYGILN